MTLFLAGPRLNRRSPIKEIFAVAALLVSGGYALAGTVVYDDTAFITTGGADVAGTTLFDSFSTGGASGSFSGLERGLIDSTPSDGGTITIALYADSTSCSSFSTSDYPGAFVTDLGTVLDSSLTTTDSLITISLIANPALSAGTRYWIILTEPTLGGGSPLWDPATSASGTGVSGEFNGDGNYPYTTTFAVESNSTGVPYVMQVTVATAIAREPARHRSGT